MIAIGTDHFFTFLTVLIMLVAGIACIRQWWQDNTHGWNISEELLCRCQECRLIFIGKRIESMTRCPSCQSLIRIRDKKSSKRMRY